jgi:hypothetical protein
VTFHRDDSENDYRTGNKTVTKQVWDLRKVIVLPRKLSEKFVYDLSFIATNKNFTYGGIFDASSRNLILDSNEAGTYVPQMRDYFVFEGKRWNVVETNTFEFGAGFVIVGQEVVGAPVLEHHVERARNRCLFTQEAINV